MRRTSIVILVLACVNGCSSSNGDQPADSAVDDSGVGDTKKDTRPADDTDMPEDFVCPALGSPCPDGAFVGCASDWKGVNRWECHAGLWCAEPGVPPSFSDASCPASVPTAGEACTPPSGPSGYQWCGYSCADGAVHAMVCAGGIWCGDATSTCTLVTNPDAGSDADVDAASDVESDAGSETDGD